MADPSAYEPRRADPSAYEPRGADPSEALVGLDVERLGILGRLVHAKRLGKIEGVLPSTCRCVGMHAPVLLREFAIACFPATLARRDNARQLHDFIVAYDGALPLPCYLADLVRLEYLAASAMFAARDRELSWPVTRFHPAWDAFDVRAAPELALLETEFDLQQALGDSPPAKLERGRPRWVAVVPGEAEARVFWLEDEVASLLLDLADWTRVRVHERAGVHAVIESLTARGLVEVRPCDYV